MVYWLYEKNYSESVAAEIDKEVSSIIEKAYNAAKKIITKRKSALEAIAKELMKKETLERDDFDALIKQFKFKLIEV